MKICLSGAPIIAYLGFYVELPYNDTISPAFLYHRDFSAITHHDIYENLTMIEILH